MTAWTTISNALVAVGAKPFATTMQALRDNVIAAFEGDATAVAAGIRLQFPAMGAWYSTAGDVGSLAFATRTSGTADVAFGGTLAGSNLSPCSASFANQGSAGGSPTTGASLAGTWRCLGYYDHQSTSLSSNVGATLWIRIS